MSGGNDAPQRRPSVCASCSHNGARQAARHSPQWGRPASPHALPASIARPRRRPAADTRKRSAAPHGVPDAVCRAPQTQPQQHTCSHRIRAPHVSEEAREHPLCTCRRSLVSLLHRKASLQPARIRVSQLPGTQRKVWARPQERRRVRAPAHLSPFHARFVLSRLGSCPRRIAATTTCTPEIRTSSELQQLKASAARAGADRSGCGTRGRPHSHLQPCRPRPPALALEASAALEPLRGLLPHLQ